MEETSTSKAVSDNYFIMAQKMFGNTCYSVCEKLPWDGTYNAMREGMFHCSPDDWVFGSPLANDYPDLYEFNSEEVNQKYLQEFEDGVSHLSIRRGVPIYDLYIKII